MSTATQVGLRIGNAVRKIEGIYVPRNGRGMIQLPFDHPFKVWVKSTGAATFEYAVCEIHPDVVVDPVSLAGRVWVPDEMQLEISALTWTAVTESGWIFLDLTDTEAPVFDFYTDAELESFGFTSNQCPIAQITIVGSSAQCRQLQFGDIYYRTNSVVFPVKLTARVSATLYTGSVFENGEALPATEIGVSIHVHELSDGSSGETIPLPLNVFFHATKQTWITGEVEVQEWTLIEVPRAVPENGLFIDPADGTLNVDIASSSYVYNTGWLIDGNLIQDRVLSSLIGFNEDGQIALIPQEPGEWQTFLDLSGYVNVVNGLGDPPGTAVWHEVYMDGTKLMQKTIACGSLVIDDGLLYYDTSIRLESEQTELFDLVDFQSTIVPGDGLYFSDDPISELTVALGTGLKFDVVDGIRAISLDLGDGLEETPTTFVPKVKINPAEVDLAPKLQIAEGKLQVCMKKVGLAVDGDGVKLVVSDDYGAWDTGLDAGEFECPS